VSVWVGGWGGEACGHTRICVRVRACVFPRPEEQTSGLVIAP
jgi:hypothetical protein